MGKTFKYEPTAEEAVAWCVSHSARVEYGPKEVYVYWGGWDRSALVIASDTTFTRAVGKAAEIARAARSGLNVGKDGQPR